MALFLKLLKPGGRAAVIVPDGVLFGSSTAHKDLRKMLVEDQKLDGIVKLPSGVFRPYAGVSTAILFFTSTDSGGTDNVWFYDVQADGLQPRRQAEPDRRPTTSPTCSTAGQNATRDRTRRGPAPTRASACPRPTSSPRATTSP